MIIFRTAVNPVKDLKRIQNVARFLTKSRKQTFKNPYQWKKSSKSVIDVTVDLICIRL